MSWKKNSKEWWVHRPILSIVRAFARSRGSRAQLTNWAIGSGKVSSYLIRGITYGRSYEVKFVLLVE